MGKGPEIREVFGRLMDDIVQPFLGTLAGVTADTIDYAHRKGRESVIKIADRIDTANEQPDKTRIGRARQKIAEAARNAIESAKEVKIVDNANIHRLPRLLDDDGENFEFKAIIFDSLNSAIGTISPLYELVALAANRSLEKGIPQERVVAFFESERILKLLLQKVFNDKKSKHRSPSLVSAISSTMDATTGNLRAFKKKTEKTTQEVVQKKEIDEETRKKLERKIKTFKDEYKPDDSYKFTDFITALKNDFSEYDLTQWLEEKTPFFIEMLRGFRIEKGPDGTEMKKITGIQHIENMVKNAYEEKTKKHNSHEEFAKTNLGKFFHLINPEQMVTPWKEVRGKPCFMIDMDELNEFFEELKTLETKETGEGQLIAILIKICRDEISKQGDMKNGITIMIKKGNTAEITTISNAEDINGKIAGIINQAIKVSSPHVNTQNLLVNPEGTPEKILREHETIFDKDGKIKQREYNALLRSIFEHREEDKPSGERMDAIKKRIVSLFKETNATLEYVLTSASVEMPKEVEDIFEINEYSELIKIATTEKDKRKKYVARLKIEIAWLIYRCFYSPRFVFRKSDARNVKAKIQATEDDIQIDNSREIRVVKFIDHSDGNPEILDEDKINEHTLPQDTETGEIRLIPAKFSGQSCYLLYSGDSLQEGGQKNQQEYISLKSLRSMVIKKIIDKQTNPEDITDMIRMTFVVNNMDELKQLKNNLEINHSQGGRLIKWEDTYTDTREHGMSNLRQNNNKSKKYKTLTATSYVPIFGDDKIYVVKLEMRVLLLEDAVKERSNYNEIGHKAYEERRSIECAPTMTPIEIFPEKYSKEKHPDSYSGRTTIRIIRTPANKVSSASQEKETSPSPSLPASL